MLVESNAPSKAILELIPVTNITNLVIGTKQSPFSRFVFTSVVDIKLESTREHVNVSFHLYVRFISTRHVYINGVDGRLTLLFV